MLKTNSQQPRSTGLPSSARLPDMWNTLKQSYTEILTFRSGIQNDVLAGLTVAAVALPLNIALAIACGLSPMAGLIAGVVGGAIAALFGGSSFQVTGPAAALNTMVFAIAQQHGNSGVAAAALAVGIVQITLIVTGAAAWIAKIPESILAGFTTGVGLKLLDGQLPRLFSIGGAFHQRLGELPHISWAHDIAWHGVVGGLIVMVCVLAFREWRKFPAALTGVAIATGISAFYGWDIEVVGPINGTLATPMLPLLSLEGWGDIAIAALPLGVLAAAESLISAKAVDRLAAPSKPHHPNLELFGQGLANMAVAFFGGMPVSGVIVRSSVNVQSGAKTRLAAFFHAGILLVAVLFCASALATVPLAALAGLLAVVGFRLLEFKTLFHFLAHERAEAMVFLMAAVGTASGHLIGGLSAALLTWGLLKFHSSRESRLLRKLSHNRETPPKGIRAVLRSDSPASKATAHLQVQNAQHSDTARWVVNLRQPSFVGANAFVNGRASVTGRVVLGRYVHIAAEASVRADEGSPFYIGDSTNIQDGVVLHALKDKWVRVSGQDWAIFIGKKVSVAHQALVHGPCFIGDSSFIGFKAVVHDAVVGARCYIGIGATVVGVQIPEGRCVPNGHVVDTAEKAAALGKVTPGQLEFNEDVVEVNRGLADAYRHQISTTTRSGTTFDVELGHKTTRMAFSPCL